MRFTVSPCRVSVCLRHALLCLILIGTACATTPRDHLSFKYDETGVPTSFKRRERFPQRDYIHHWTRTAYTRTVQAPMAPAGSDQAATLRDLGTPEWTRKPFTSLEGERVDEWAYISQHRIFQFVNGQLVYDGPLTDIEQMLMLRGYPDKADVMPREPGSDLTEFYYHHVFSLPWVEQFHFVNDQLIEGQEGF